MVLRTVQTMVATLILGGCAAGQPDETVRGSIVEHEQQARNALRSAEPDRAQAALRTAIAEVPQQENDAYYDNYLYRDRHRLMAGKAWLALERGDPRAARRLYDNVFVGLVRAERKHAEHRRLEDARANLRNAMINIGIQVGYSLGGGPGTPMLQLPTDIETEPAAKAIYGPAAVESGFVRMVPLPSVGALRRIGKLIAETSSCTASLVGRRLALTNAHCVHTEDDELRDTSAMSVIFTGLDTQERIPVIETHSPSDYGSHAWAKDWALLELAVHPTGRGYFGVKREFPAEAARGDIVIAGYSADLNDGRFLSMDYGCSLKPYSDSDGPPSDILTYDCWTYKGASGAPVLTTRGERPMTYVVGVNSFGIADDEATGAVDTSGAGGAAPERFFEAVRKLRRRTDTPKSPDEVRLAPSHVLEEASFYNRVTPCTWAGYWFEGPGGVIDYGETWIEAVSPYGLEAKTDLYRSGPGVGDAKKRAELKLNSEMRRAEGEWEGRTSLGMSGGGPEVREIVGSPFEMQLKAPASIYPIGVAPWRTQTKLAPGSCRGAVLN